MSLREKQIFTDKLKLLFLRAWLVSKPQEWSQNAQKTILLKWLNQTRTCKRLLYSIFLQFLCYDPITTYSYLLYTVIWRINMVHTFVIILIIVRIEFFHSILCVFCLICNEIICSKVMFAMEQSFGVPLLREMSSKCLSCRNTECLPKI